MKTYWCVTSSFDDRGRATAAVTDSIKAISKPESTFISTSRKDIYNDWFDSLEAARDDAEQAKGA